MRVAPLLVLVTLVASASAETLGTFTYTPPSGYTAALEDQKHVYTRIDGVKYCVVGLFLPRASGDLTADVTQEWREVVESQFVVGPITSDKAKTSKQRMTVSSMRSTLAPKGGGDAFFGNLLVVSGKGVVGSILVAANSEQDLPSCRPGVGVVVDSITVSASPASTPLGTTSNKVEQGIAGTWSASSGGASDAVTGMSHGSITRQYVFRTDGTYRFYSENWRGHHSGGNSYYVVDESGTYSIAGNNVTVTPKKASGVVRESSGKVRETSKVPLEKATYQWSFHYFEGIQDNQLVLTPAGGKATRRDGTLGGNGAFPASYLMSAQYKPEWKFPPP